MVKAFTDDNIANAWFLNTEIFRPSKCMTALKMRENVTGAKVAFTRARIKGDIACRKCRTQTKTLGHTLDHCIHTKERIKRHKEIKDSILK